MARAKKINRESSFVTLRIKPVSKGRLSYYLDIYKDGQRKYEFLKLYLVPATNEAAKVQNTNTEQAAKAIRNQRELEIIQGKGPLRCHFRPPAHSKPKFPQFTDKELLPIVKNIWRELAPTPQQ